MRTRPNATTSATRPPEPKVVGSTPTGCNESEAVVFAPRASETQTARNESGGAEPSAAKNSYVRRSPTFHGDLVDRAVHELRPDEAGVLWGVARDLNQGGAWDPLLVDAIFQKSQGRAQIEDAYCFVRIMNALMDGRYALGAVEIGETPSADANVERNQAVLNAALEQHGFKAWVTDSKHAECDGAVDFEPNELAMRVTIPDGDGVRLRTWLHSFQVPLEIGTTAASRTLVHMHDARRGVARWPYGSTRLIVIVATEFVDAITKQKFSGFGRWADDTAHGASVARPSEPAHHGDSAKDGVL